MKGRLLTIKMLRNASACREQLIKFERIFGDRVVVTPELAALCCRKLSVCFLGNFMSLSRMNAVFTKNSRLWFDNSVPPLDRSEIQARNWAVAFIRAGKSKKAKKPAPKKKAKRS